MPTKESRPIPGGAITKIFASAAEIRAEMQRHIDDGPLDCRKIVAPIPVPANRGRYWANWCIESWSDVPASCRAFAQEIAGAVQREWEMG
jgi:hypothetical protein